MSIFNTLRNVINTIEDVVNRVEVTIKEPTTREPTGSGLSLVKGQRLTLEKNGQQLSNVCIGVNWGRIGHTAVDLDVSCITYSGKTKQDLVYFGNLRSTGITHSGDDLTGDSGGDDGLDNEVITIDLNRIPSNTDQIFIVLNSYRGHKFDHIPYATIRIYEGTAKRVDFVLANYNIANDVTFKDKVCMVLGSLYRHGNGWKFNAIGEPTTDSNLNQLVSTISSQYL
jgi:tellurium resistance protein TerZ